MEKHHDYNTGRLLGQSFVLLTERSRRSIVTSIHDAATSGGGFGGHNVVTCVG